MKTKMDESNMKTRFFSENNMKTRFFSLHVGTRNTPRLVWAPVCACADKRGNAEAQKWKCANDANFSAR